MFLTFLSKRKVFIFLSGILAGKILNLFIFFIHEVLWNQSEILRLCYIRRAPLNGMPCEFWEGPRKKKINRKFPPKRLSRAFTEALRKILARNPTSQITKKLAKRLFPKKVTPGKPGNKNFPWDLWRDAGRFRQCSPKNSEKS